MSNLISSDIELLKINQLQNVLDDLPNIYYLMLQDLPVLKVNRKEFKCTVLQQKGLPLFLRAFKEVTMEYFYMWLAKRSIPTNRENFKDIVGYLNLDEDDRITINFISKSLSLTDCYWLKYSDKDTWDSVNLYKNKFSESIGEVSFKGLTDLTIEGEFITPELTNQGMFRKRWKRDKDGIYLYKANTANGLGVYSEYVSTEVLRAVNLPVTKYELVEYEDELVTKCKIITNPNLSIETYRDFATFCIRKNTTPQVVMENLDPFKFWSLCITDYLVNNTDRHTGNWGVYVEGPTGRVLTIHDFFDYNLAFDLKRLETESKIFIGHSMEEIAKIAYKKLNKPQFVYDLKKYLETKEARNLFRENFETTDQHELIRERINKLMEVV